ncbi:phage minor capsid protein [Anaeromassilibacillus senegalensis]|uniref:phage minor capsid protein n=1 Tax=Anaeromassilibacillus senegalensis TaxID=1673717 RepID=UPI000680E671|nr:phage minor capsid protein [Anaeromassilibacillus senegalensis]
MTAAEELLNLYEAAQKKLVEIIQRKALGGSPAVYERNVLKQITELLKKLKKATPEVVRQMVLEGYKTGLESAVEDILKVKIPAPPVYNLFSRIHAEQINLIVRNTVDSLTKAVNIVGRRMQDEIREAGLRATAMKTATGGTVREMQKDLEQRLLGLNLRQQSGRMGVRYKNGKIVPLDKYAAMVSRTTPAEAQNKAKIVQAAEWGYDLVRCTTHAPTCEICAQYQGRVYALTREAANGKYQSPNGEPLRFPLLYETALVHGYETIHPNCRHRFTILPARAYSRAELAEMSRMSMRPFEDTRSDAECKAYAQEQAVKRARNDDLREWKRYKSLLPEDAPKTFAGFRSMKRANSVRYQQLKWDAAFLQEYGVDADHPPLPNYEWATGIDKKLIGYSLNKYNESGKNKALVFDRALRYTEANADVLEAAIKEGLVNFRAIHKGNKGYGEQFEVRMLIRGPNGNKQPVITGWIFDTGKDTPRMVTAYVDDNKRAQYRST